MNTENPILEALKHEMLSKIRKLNFTAEDVTTSLLDEGLSPEETQTVLRSIGFSAYVDNEMNLISVSEEITDPTTYPSTPNHGKSILVPFSKPPVTFQNYSEPE